MRHALLRRFSSQLSASLLARPRPRRHATAAASTTFPSEPRVGVGVVALRRLPEAAGALEVLLIKRGKPPALGAWSFPGGSQELGETVVACAARELLEETGVRLRHDGGAGVTSAGLARPTAFAAADVMERAADGRLRYHYAIVEVAGVPEDPRAELRVGADAADARWVRVDALRALEGLVPNAADVAEEAARRFMVD
jgi:ADP-ribose pyrophosphatase YjhB (NUDIX family)